MIRSKKAEELWGISDIPREFKLSKEEEKRIYDLIGNIENETEKQERIKQLSSVEPDFMDKLALMDGEYKEAVEATSTLADLTMCMRTVQSRT